VPLSIAAADGIKTLDLFEPPQAVSFQHPVNSEKYPSNRGINFRYPPQADGTAGCSFLAPSFGQAKEGGIK